MIETEWTITGAEGEPILGVCHEPDGEARGAIVLCHGFKGYMDYGMFPRLARESAAAGFIVHRFNFSHSGMTREFETFRRPDLFERDTWMRQVHDLGAVMSAVARGEIAGSGLPMVVFGHSRGGATTLLTVGLDAMHKNAVRPAGLIVAATPSACCSMDAQTRRDYLEKGFLESPSARTGQVLRLGKAWLQEQLDDPASHDLCALAGGIDCPVLIVHGTDDPTVPASCAGELRHAIGSSATVKLIEGGNHVFNTTNPMEVDAPMSAQLREVVDSMLGFARIVCDEKTARPAMG